MNYQYLANDIEIKLVNYRLTLNHIDKIIIPLNTYTVDYDYERSIGPFVTTILHNSLLAYGCKDVYSINEYSLKLLHPISNTSAKRIENEVDEVTIDRKSTKKIPDALISIIDKDNKMKLIYVEYKVEDKFSYIKLAQDFAKFKVYTDNSTAENIFIYMVFNPNNNGLNISLSKSIGSNPIVMKLNNIINKASFNNSANFYYYENGSNNNTNPLILTPEIEKLFIKIEDLVNKLEDIDYLEDYIGIVDYSDNVFIKNQHKFGPNVLTSHRVQKKYNEINNFYEYCIKNKEKIELPKDSYIDIDQINTDDFDFDQYIGELSNHFNNQIKKQNDKEESAINNAAFSYNRKRSLWILILLQKFADDLKYETDLLFFETDKEKEDYEKLRVNLIESYKGDTAMNLHKLAFGMLFYIVNLYKIIFTIETEQPIYNSMYEAYEIKVQLINEITKLIKKIGIRNHHISSYSDPQEIGIKLIEKLVNLDNEKNSNDQ